MEDNKKSRMKFFTALNIDPALLSGETSLPLVNINWIIKGEMENEEDPAVMRRGSPGVTPDWIVQFPRRKSLRVPQLQLQIMPITGASGSGTIGRSAKTGKVIATICARDL